MARGGVTYTEVDETAHYLQGLGRNPTVDAIRERLGTGSRTTLAEHLKRWKSLQVNGEGRLPQPLLALVIGLWDSLQSLAEEKLHENQSIAREEANTFKSQLQIAQQTEIQLRQEIHQLQETLNTEQRTKATLLAQLQAAETARDKTEALHQSTSQQLTEAKQENQRLHKLAAQMQVNLEHYQASIQQQQLEQNLARENQQVALTQELSQLKAALGETKLRCEQSEKSLEWAQHQLQKTQAEYEKLAENQEKLLRKNQDAENTIITLQAGEKLQQKQLERNQQEISVERDLSQSLNQKVAVLNEQLQRVRADLDQATDKVDTLRQEKLFLIEEKFRLDGAVKQLEKAMAVAR